jgi:hypothetical protein
MRPIVLPEEGAASDHLAALDHHVDVLERAHVAQRIAVHRDDVAEAADRDRADVLFRPSACAALRVAAWIASIGVIPILHHGAELAGGGAVRHHARVGAEHHLHARRCAARKLSRWICADLAVLAEIVLEHAVLLALGLGIFGVEDVHREPDRLPRCRRGGCPRRRPGWHARSCRCRRGSPP